MVLYKDCSNYAPGVKIGPAPGVTSFALGSIGKTFKRHLLLNLWQDFDETSHECFLGKPRFRVVQTVPVRCIIRSQELKIDFQIENFKNLLV